MTSGRCARGYELLVNDLGEHHLTFSVAFDGDQEKAIAAADRWIERVKTFGGIAARGTDRKSVV